jgi:DNA-binding transcriptional MerR regulator
MLPAMESLQTELMSIGRFARLTGLTVKALRHYDEVGLLRPASVDAETGYRSYGAEQVHRAETIRALRRLELPLDDVATLLTTDDPALLRRVLVDHQRRTTTRSAELKIVLQGLQPLIDGKEPVMDMKAETLDREAHRQLGVDLFNKTWTLMDKEGRTAAEDDEMIHCAHASAYHWLQVGTAANRARSEWQCSRMYTVLGRGEPAVQHAQRCLEICESSPEALEDWDLPFAYEALARAHALAGDDSDAKRHLAHARELVSAVADEDDRALLETDLATIVT